MALALVTMPPPLVQDSSLLDDSWNLGLVLAHQRHLSFGTDVLWTYGPWGWIDSTSFFFRREWALSLAAAITAHLIFIALLGILLLRARAGGWAWLLVTVALLQPNLVVPSVEYELILSLVLLLGLAACEGRRLGALLAAGLAGPMAGLLVVLKGSDLIVVGSVLLVAGALLWLQQRRIHIGVVAAAGLVTMVVLWQMGGQGLGNVVPWLRSVLAIGAGYFAAMSYGGSSGATLVGALLTGAVVTVAILAWRAQNQRLLCLATLLVPVAVVTWREAFVRAGERRFLFFGWAVIALAMLAADALPKGRIATAGEGPREQAALWARGIVVVALVATAGILLQSDLNAPLSTINDRWTAYGDALHMLTDSRAAIDHETARRAQLRDAYQLRPRIVAALSQGTADVYPWDIDALYAYGLERNWTPRPVLAAYAGYSTSLDGDDAAFYRGPTAPLHVLYHYGSIDDRYPLFDEPQTLTVLLTTYRVVDDNGGEGAASFLLLERRATPVDATAAGAGDACASFGTPLHVPTVPGHLTFADLNIPYSLLGRLKNTLYKPGDVRIAFTLSDGRVLPVQRIIPAVASGGVLVSAYAATQDDVRALFAGRATTAASALTISSPDAADYGGTICAHFTTVVSPPA